MVTTGGTGPAVRDVTPEATEAVREHLKMQLPMMALLSFSVFCRDLGRSCNASFCARCLSQVCERMMPGYGEQMRAISLRQAAHCRLSLQ